MERYDFTRIEDVRRWCDAFAQRFSPARATMSGGYRGTAMTVDGYGASVMLAPRLERAEGNGLPPGYAAPAYSVAPYAGCPSDWRRQNDAFFIPVPIDDNGKGPGMWYDWTMNTGHTHDVAIVPSTTGLNPITFRKADALRLERYRDRCPVHDVAFEGERFCSRCNDGRGLQWPPQNYVAAPNTLWWDGFRRPDGTVRQFWFSDDVLRRDVGVAVLGADRVPAFGFAFFRATQPKPAPAPRMGTLLAGQSLDGGGMMKGGGDGTGLLTPLADCGFMRGTGPSPSAIRRQAVERTVAVGAGSGITQDLRSDPKSLDEWQADPAAVITVYFVPKDVAVAILEGPKRDFTGPREGALASIAVRLGTD